MRGVDGVQKRFSFKAATICEYKIGGRSWSVGGQDWVGRMIVRWIKQLLKQPYKQGYRFDHKIRKWSGMVRKCQWVVVDKAS